MVVPSVRAAYTASVGVNYVLLLECNLQCPGNVMTMTVVMNPHVPQHIYILTPTGTIEGSEVWFPKHCNMYIGFTLLFMLAIHSS